MEALGESRVGADGELDLVAVAFCFGGVGRRDCKGVGLERSEVGDPEVEMLTGCPGHVGVFNCDDR